MSKSKSVPSNSSPTTPTAASRTQGAVAHGNGGHVPKGSYVGRLQGAAARNFSKSGGK